MSSSDVMPQNIFATLNKKYNGRNNQTNLRSVTRIEIIYFRCNTDVSSTLKLTLRLRSLTRVLDGDALHKNTVMINYSQAEGNNQPLSVIPPHKIPNLDPIFCNQTHARCV